MTQGTSSRNFRHNIARKLLLFTVVIFTSDDGVTPLSRLADDDDEMGDEEGKKQPVPR